MVKRMKTKIRMQATGHIVKKSDMPTRAEKEEIKKEEKAGD